MRAALIVAATIPLSLLCAFIGMRVLGLSANLMSLGAIDFGMIVDGSIVMTEHFVRTLHEDEARDELPREQSAFLARLIEAGREVARPIAFGVLIILLVYIPILTLQGLEGRMFPPMAMTVAIALFGSLMLALTFVPAAVTWAFRGGVRESRYALRLAAWLDRHYSRVLHQTIRRPGLTLAVALALFAGALMLVPRLGTEFLPELDEGAILIEAVTDPSVSLTRSIEMQRDVQRVAAMSPEVTTVVSWVGRPDVGSDPMGINQADVFVMLEPRSKWRPGMTKERLQEEIEGRLQDRVPGMAFGFTQPMQMRLDELISGVRADLAVKVFGDDPAQNRQVPERIAAAVQTVPGA